MMILMKTMMGNDEGRTFKNDCDYHMVNLQNAQCLPLLGTKLVLNTWLITLTSLSPVQSNILHNFNSVSVTVLVSINVLI